MIEPVGEESKSPTGLFSTELQSLGAADVLVQSGQLLGAAEFTELQM